MSKSDSLFVYLMASPNNKALYTGMTNDLIRRSFQHREKRVPGFTQRYNVTKLVYFEQFETPREAIEREKQIQSWSRKRKNDLVEAINPHWEDLYESLL